MTELKIKTDPGDFIKAIEFNYDEIKQEMQEKVAVYKAMVYTEDQIKDAKADRAELNKTVKALEDKRKEIKALCLAPYEAFEKQMKDLVAVVNEPINVIDAQIKAYEDQKKEEKKAEIEAYYQTLDFSGVALEKVFDQKWLNASVSMNTVRDALDKRAQEIATDLLTLKELPEYAFEAVDMYHKTLDLRQAIAEATRLKDLDERKKAAEEIKVAQKEPEKVAEPEPIIPEDNFMPDFDEIKDSRENIVFKVFATPDEIGKITDFLMVNKIQFDRIGG